MDTTRPLLASIRIKKRIIVELTLKKKNKSVKYKILEKNEVLKKGDEYNVPRRPECFIGVTGIGVTTLEFKKKYKDYWDKRIFRRPIVKRKIG